MKKFLAIAGGVFLVLVLVVVGGIGYFTYQGNKLDKASKAYAEESISLIVSKWSKEELLLRSSPEMIMAIGDKTKDFDKLFLMFSKLGKLKSLGKMEGDSLMSYTSKEGKVTTAKYSTKCKFEKSDAEITIQLIERYNQWQIFSFNVSSSMFLQAVNK